MVDFIGRFENIEKDWEIVCQKIGKEIELPMRMKSHHKDYHEFYNEKTKQMIAEIYAKDIEKFGYKF